jgi:zinc protease
MHIVGKIDKKRVEDGLQSLVANWKAFDVEIPELAVPKAPETSKIYFVDVPGAKQSVINIGNFSMTKSDENYYPATVMNYKLGGSFNGIVNLILREEKGYTYGARTSFSGGKAYGTFKASSSVRSSATLESVNIFKTEMEKYVEGIDNEGLEFTKNALLKSNARRFETLYSQHYMLTQISLYDLDLDYVKQEEEFLKSLTKEVHKELAQKYIDAGKMYYVIVGDAETQFDAMKNLGLGTPVLLKN